MFSGTINLNFKLTSKQVMLLFIVNFQRWNNLCSHQKDMEKIFNFGKLMKPLDNFLFPDMLEKKIFFMFTSVIFTCVACKVFYVFEISFQYLNSFECCRKKLKWISTQSFLHNDSLLYRIWPQSYFYMFIFATVENKLFWKSSFFFAYL